MAGAGGEKFKGRNEWRRMRMKVLQVNSVYDFGSTGKITADIHRLLPQYGIDSIVCYGRGAKAKDGNVYRICNDFYSHVEHFRANITGIMYGGCEWSTHRLIEIIKKEKPDVVHLQCLNNYFVNIYQLVEWLKGNHIPTVLTLHAEFMYTGGCGHSIDCNQWSTRKGCGHSICPRYRSELKSLFGDRSSYMWHRMKKAFDGFDEGLIIASVSPWLMERAARAPILANKQQCVIYNGLDTNVFKYYDGAKLRAKHHCENKKVVFHATPAFSTNPNHLKGGYYVIELAKRLPDVCFIVAGQVTGEFDVPTNLILLGKLDSQELLAGYYSMADATVLTSKRETFSMVCAESLCCGTPVVGFKAGAPEQISLGEFSSFVASGDLPELANALEQWLNQKKDKIYISKVAKRMYAKETMVENYVKLYEGLIHGEGSYYGD